MRKKNLLWSMMSVAMAAMLGMSLTACGGGDDDSSSPAPGTDGLTVSGQDPEGTVVINMKSGPSGNYYDIGLKAKIHVDENNNFVTDDKGDYYNAHYCHVEFASLGKVNGLSNVKTPPSTGWTKSIAVIPGHGYMVRSMYYERPYGTYARLYVVEQNNNEVTTVKYQTPYSDFPFSLEKTNVIFNYNMDNFYLQPGDRITACRKHITIINGTKDVLIAEKPEWLEAIVGYHSYDYGCYLRITVKGEDKIGKTGKIVLKNSVCTQTLTVTVN